MSNFSEYLDFQVTLCLGLGDGGDVCVNVGVTENEFKLLKECYREYGEVQEIKGLIKLCRRVERAARDENESCLMDFDTEEKINYRSVSYIIGMPDEVIEAVEEEDSEEGEEEQ